MIPSLIIVVIASAYLWFQVCYTLCTHVKNLAAHLFVNETKLSHLAQVWHILLSLFTLNLVPVCYLFMNNPILSFFFQQGFLSQTLTINATAGEVRRPALVLSNTSTHLRKSRHLFATLHVRWLSRVFNCTACIYHTTARWDLPPSSIIIWLLDDGMLISVYLMI